MEYTVVDGVQIFVILIGLYLKFKASKYDLFGKVEILTCK